MSETFALNPLDYSVDEENIRKRESSRYLRFEMMLIRLVFNQNKLRLISVPMQRSLFHRLDIVGLKYVMMIK
jgi:hypothetical protein